MSLVFPTRLFPFAAPALAVRMGVVIPLTVACLAVALAIPSAARRGKLNQAAYAVMAIGAMLLGWLTGYAAGLRHIRGTVWGVALSVLFYLLIAASLGCFASLLFYKEPES